MTKKKQYGKGNPPPGWTENVGRWGKDKEAQLEASRKGGLASAEKRKKEAAARKLLEDKNEFILESAAQVTAENPEWFTKMLTTLIAISEDESTDAKTRMEAMDKISAIIGTCLLYTSPSPRDS